jgi:molecular chaperone GrpE
MPNKAGKLDDDDMMGEPEIISPKSTEKPEKNQTQTQAQPQAAAESQGLIENPERAALEDALTKAEDKALRAVAEMENIRRRSEQRVAEAHKYSVSKLLEELIPVLDSLEQSLTVKESDHELVKSMREGMVMTLQIMIKALEKFGVKEINPVNQLFNPALHEVMLAQENAELPPNTIIAVMQKGYQLHDRLIRPARVMISKAAA